MVTANRVLNHSGSACNVWTTLQPPPKSITLYSVHPRCPAHRVMGNDQSRRRGGRRPGWCDQTIPAALPVSCSSIRIECSTSSIGDVSCRERLQVGNQIGGERQLDHTTPAFGSPSSC